MTGCPRAASLTLAAQAAVNSNFSEVFFFIIAVTFRSGYTMSDSEDSDFSDNQSERSSEAEEVEENEVTSC